jgi:hypothetical protein
LLIEGKWRREGAPATGIELRAPSPAVIASEAKQSPAIWDQAARDCFAAFGSSQ